MFNSIINESISIGSFLACIICSLVLGVIIALLHMYTSKSNKNFITSIAVLPALVAAVIIMVNGNLGTSIAVVGAFSLVRFRSLPGNSKEILNIFFSMAIGLACGTGYIGYACIFTLVVSLFMLLLYLINFGESKNRYHLLKINIPENLDYTNCFDEIFNKYLNKYELVKSKTINMGSMFDLTYYIKFKNSINEKELIDEIRVLNGNLKVVLSHELNDNEL